MTNFESLPECDRIVMIAMANFQVGTYRELVDQGVDFKVEIEEKSKKVGGGKEKEGSRRLGEEAERSRRYKKSPKGKRRKGRASRGRGAGGGEGVDAEEADATI